MPTITIDGKPIDFKPGESIIAAATRQKVEIPYYCWHPRLSVAANCRMCLVELEKAPKLVPACQTECKEGMVVKTQTDKVRDMQRAVHEMLLINHPIDCPICDQAGECKLQDYYMKWDLTGSRMKDAKTVKPRHQVFGPHVIYNAERCIMCTRCVRYVNEVAKAPQLGIFERGGHAEIGVFPGQELNNPYSLGVVDVCPVGALTSREFRFKQRVWNLKRSPSICGGCARGCNIHVDQRSGNVYRFLPRENGTVNQEWLCDEGRLTTQRANARLTHAIVKGPGGVDASEVNAARKKAVELLAPVAQARSGLGAALSLHATCEEAYVFGRFVKELLGGQSVALIEHAAGEADAILRVADKNPNRAGVTKVLRDLGLEVTTLADLTKKVQSGGIKALLVVGHEGAELDGFARAAARVEVVVHVAAVRGAFAEAATVTLPGLAWVQVDGTWVNGQNRAQHLTPAFGAEADARANHQWLLDLASDLGVKFALPSVQTIRAEMERQLPSFKDSKLTSVGGEGHVLAWG